MWPSPPCFIFLSNAKHAGTYLHREPNTQHIQQSLAKIKHKLSYMKTTVSMSTNVHENNGVYKSNITRGLGVLCERLTDTGDVPKGGSCCRIGASFEELVGALVGALVEVLVDVVAVGEQITSVSDILGVSLVAGKCGI